MWLMFQALGARAAGVLSQLALARLLLPAQFGVISIVYIVTSIAQTVTSFGIDAVLLQRRRTYHLWTRAAFWTSLGLGVIGLIIVLALGPVFAQIYHSPEIIGLSAVLALAMPIGALSTVPSVRMQSEMEFKFPAVYSTMDTFASAIATVALAYLGAGAMSFVIPVPALGMVRAVVYWLRVKPRLGKRVRKLQIKYLVNNGSQIFLSRIANQVISQGDYAILGLFASHSIVGFYYFAFRLAVQPVWMLAGNFNNVLMPGLVNLSLDAKRQLRAALRGAELLSYIVMPACFLQAALAGPGLRMLFGQKWLGSIDLMRLLSMSIAFDAATWVANCLLNARRDYKHYLIYTAFSVPPFLVLVGAGAFIGSALGVAIAVSVYYLVLGPTYSAVAFGRYGASLNDVARLYVKPPLIAGLSVGIGFLASTVPPVNGTDLGRVAVTTAVSVGFYAALLWQFERGVFAELMRRFGLDRLEKHLRRFRRSGAQLP